MSVRLKIRVIRRGSLVTMFRSDLEEPSRLHCWRPWALASSASWPVPTSSFDWTHDMSVLPRLLSYTSVSQIRLILINQWPPLNKSTSCKWLVTNEDHGPRRLHASGYFCTDLRPIILILGRICGRDADLTENLKFKPMRCSERFEVFHVCCCVPQYGMGNGAILLVVSAYASGQHLTSSRTTKSKSGFSIHIHMCIYIFVFVHCHYYSC